MARPSALVDTRVIYCGDNAPPSPPAVSLRSALEQLKNLPPACVDLIYRGGCARDKRRPGNGRTDPPFNSNRTYEDFCGETKEKRAFEDRHESTRAYIDTMHPRCVELARVLKKTGSFYYHCDWHAARYAR